MNAPDGRACGPFRKEPEKRKRTLHTSYPADACRSESRMADNRALIGMSLPLSDSLAKSVTVRDAAEDPTGEVDTHDRATAVASEEAALPLHPALGQDVL